jgi:hypothetical protein
MAVNESREDVLTGEAAWSEDGMEMTEGMETGGAVIVTEGTGRVCESDRAKGSAVSRFREDPSRSFKRNVRG